VTTKQQQQQHLPDPKAAASGAVLHGMGRQVLGALLSLFSDKEMPKGTASTSPPAPPPSDPKTAPPPPPPPGSKSTQTERQEQPKKSAPAVNEPATPATKPEQGALQAGQQQPGVAKASLPPRPTWEELREHAAKVMLSERKASQAPGDQQQMAASEQWASSGTLPGQHAQLDAAGQVSPVLSGQCLHAVEVTEEQLKECSNAVSMWAAGVRPDPVQLWMSGIDPRVRGMGKTPDVRCTGRALMSLHMPGRSIHMPQCCACDPAASKQMTWAGTYCNSADPPCMSLMQHADTTHWPTVMSYFQDSVILGRYLTPGLRDYLSHPKV
jgi:hypothetical protein